MRRFWNLILVFGVLCMPAIASAAGLTYSQDYEELRRLEDAYAHANSVDPEDSESTVISGSEAIQIVSYYKEDAFDSREGEAIYDMLNSTGAKAILVEIDGANPYILVPFPDSFSPGGLTDGVIFDLVTSSCQEISASVGMYTSGWCVCMAFCDGSGCTTCNSNDPHDVAYTNDSELFSDAEVDDVLPLWD